MWNTIAVVAKARRVDALALESFALANEDRYGIVRDRGEPEVNTWHVDNLVADFKAASVAECDSQWEQRWPNAVTPPTATN